MLVTLEIIRRVIVAEGTLKPALPGDRPRTITVSAKRARQLLDSSPRSFRIPKVAAPAPEAPGEKKPSGAPTAGPSTGSASSSAPGPETPPLFSAEDPASPGPRSSARGRRRTATGGGSES